MISTQHQLLIILFLVISMPFTAFSQLDNGAKIFVWEFYENGEEGKIRNKITKTITNKFEGILKRDKSAYLIVNRRNYSDLEKINKIDNFVSGRTNTQLMNIRADVVVFGEITEYYKKDRFGHKESKYEVAITVQNFKTKEILVGETSVTFENEDLNSPAKMEEIMKSLVDKAFPTFHRLKITTGSPFVEVYVDDKHKGESKQSFKFETQLPEGKYEVRCVRKGLCDTTLNIDLTSNRTISLYRACADKDGDGVPNNKDEQPSIAGRQELGGAPCADKRKAMHEDCDGDNIKNINDDCPNVYGRLFGGCKTPKPWIGLIPMVGGAGVYTYGFLMPENDQLAVKRTLYKENTNTTLTEDLYEDANDSHKKIQRVKGLGFSIMAVSGMIATYSFIERNKKPRLVQLNFEQDNSPYFIQSPYSIGITIPLD